MAFQQVKPQCVAILQHVQLSDARNVQLLSGLLTALEATLQHLNEETKQSGTTNTQNNGTPSSDSNLQTKQQAHQLANYIFFPFSQFLQVNSIKTLRSTPSHQSVFDTFLRVLNVLVQKCELEKAVHEQLWTFIGLTLGGPLGSKSFEHAWSDAVRRRLVSLWSTILRRSNDDRQEELSLPGPIVAHTLNTLLLVLEDKDSEQDTRLECLQFLDSFVKKYLDSEDRVPQYLPGIVSTLVKVIIAQQKSGGLVVNALKPLSRAVRASLNETRSDALDLYEALPQDATPQATSLEALFAQNTFIGDSGKDIVPQGPFGRTASAPDDSVGQDGTAKFGGGSNISPEPGHSKAWLKATSSQLQRAFSSILPILRQHQNPEVRHELAHVAPDLLEHCFLSLTPLVARFLLEEVLVCSRDGWHQVSKPASEALTRLLGNSSSRGEEAATEAIGGFKSAETPCRKLLSEIASEAITSLPHSIFTNGFAHEDTLHRQLNLIIASLQCGASLTTKELKIERWSLNLLRAVEFAPIASSSNSGPSDETTPWTRTDTSSLLLMDCADQSSSASSARMIEPIDEDEKSKKGRLPPFPTLRLANVAPGQTTTLLQEALQSFHKLPGAAEILEHFLGIAGFADTGMPIGGTATVASALWIVQQIMEGLATSTGPMQSSGCGRVVGEVPALALSWLNRDDLEEIEEKLRPVQDEQTRDAITPQTENDQDVDMGPTEIQSGSLTLSGLLDAHASRAVLRPKKSSRKPTFELQVHCMSLRLLAVSAQLLRQDFQRHMMHVLYPLLRALCPSSESRLGLLQAHAYCTLHRISTSMGYETPSKMLVSNVDYILNSISAHLRGTTTLSTGALDPLAPSVLVSVIELAGEDILPYLGDAVDEIFDALDRWHAYDLLVSELLRVLDRLVNICQVEEPTASDEQEARGRAIAEVQKMQPNPETDLDSFEQWFKTRNNDRLRFKSETEKNLPDNLDDLPERNPRQPFAELTKDPAAEGEEHEGSEGDQAADQPEKEEKEVPLTKSQALVLAILRKSLYFLSHSSAFLRARVIALITSSIPILADRTSDFLPEIHRFWPYILARLDDGFERSPAFVLLEVMRLLIALMKYRGDFMNSRILKDVMPRLRTLVQRHNFQPSTKNQFTNAYRTLKAIIELVTVALRDVPGVSGQDLWTVAVLFRPFLSTSIDPEIRKEAHALYQALGQLDSDLVWLALASGLGQVGDLSVLAVPGWRPDEPEVLRLVQVL
ncbi:hypothetical protein P389DRAFT_13743 [Cystobasidium minutum MCA 4210]|uniref:uncharacterized protein n=1 Tax=Cystobasidium minutum MCA 4210 TaxID=1397322 RepID=UPI0034CD9B2A|eukprot:jgi/Rhomi1/13743/CE13742_643